MTHPLFPSHCPPAVSHHTRCLLPIHTHYFTMHCKHYTQQYTYAITSGWKGGGGGLVAGSATKMRHRFLRKTHAHNFRRAGVVCIHIQSPKHLESTVVAPFPHHQA